MKIKKLISELESILKQQGNIDVKISKKTSTLVSNNQWDNDQPLEDRTQVEVHIDTRSKDKTVKINGDCIYTEYTKSGKAKQKYLLLSC